MRIRNGIAYLALKATRALTKQDFGGDAFFSMLANQKKTGEIGWSNYAELRKQYKGTVYACIRKIAPAVAGAPLRLFIPGESSITASKRAPVSDEIKDFLRTMRFVHDKAINVEGLEEVTSHAVLNLLNEVNPRMTRYQLFDRTMIDLELTGECYWRLILDEAKKNPGAILFIPAEKMTPVDDTNGMPAGYDYKKDANTPVKRLKEKEVIQFFYPGPFSNNRGFSPTAAMSQRITGENSIATIQNSILQNMGIPPFVIKLARRMPSKEFDKFKEDWADMFGSMKKRGLPGFTEGEWAIEKIGQTLEEMGYIEGAKMWREFIANGFGVPLSKLTMESSNRAVATQGNSDFQGDTILPKLTMVAEELTENLIPRFEDDALAGAFFMFDNPVPEDMRMKMLARRINRTTGVTTPNEERAEDGMEPHPSEEAEELAPVRAPLPEQSESDAVDAIDRAAAKMIDGMRSGDCYHDEGDTE